MSRNVRNAAVALAQQGLGAVTGAVGLFAVARNLPNADVQWGIVTFGLMFVGLFVSVQRMFDAAHVKRVSEGQDLGACNGTYLVLNLLSTASMAALVLGAVFVWTTVLGKGFQSPLHVRVIEVFVVYQVLNSVGELVRRTYEGQRNILIGQIILTVEHLVKGGAMVYVAFNGLDPVVPGARDAFGVAVAYALGAGALALAAVGFFVGQPIGRPSLALAKSYWVFALPASITATVLLVNANISGVILQLFWGARDVGIYGAPNRYVQFLPAVAMALSTALFPVFSTMHARGGRTDPVTVARTLRAVSLFVLPAVAVSVALPRAIVHVLLSDRFLDSAPVLAILAVGAYVTALRMVLASKLGGVNRPEEVTRAALSSLVANVVLSIVLIPDSLFGIELFGLRAVGAALAVAIASLFGMGATLRAARRHAGVEMPPLWRHLVMFTGAVVVLALLPLLVPQTEFRIYHLLGAAAVSLGAFFTLGILVGEIDRDDIALLSHAFHPRELGGFFREEGRRPPRP